MPRSLSSAVGRAALLATASAFSPTATHQHPSLLSSASSTTTSVAASPQHATEESYPSLLQSASVCAHSDSCSIDLAEDYLREIVHVQSGCAAGTLSGGVCDDVLNVSAIVADLRVKIDEGKVGVKREAASFWDQRQDDLVTLASSVDGSAVGGLVAPIKPGYLAVAALYTILVANAFLPAITDPDAISAAVGGVVPFSGEELWWSIRDGYAPDLISHFFHNGGLLVGDASTVSPTLDHLTAQEVMWGIRDGYGFEALNADAGYAEGSLPFTPQELWWATQNGYSMDMLGQWIRNSGLAV